MPEKRRRGGGEPACADERMISRPRRRGRGRRARARGREEAPRRRFPSRRKCGLFCESAPARARLAPPRQGYLDAFAERACLVRRLPTRPDRLRDMRRGARKRRLGDGGLGGGEPGARRRRDERAPRRKRAPDEAHRLGTAPRSRPTLSLEPRRADVRVRALHRAQLASRGSDGRGVCGGVAR